MSLKMDGMVWKVVTSTRELESDNGVVAILGIMEEKENLIVIDGTANRQRQEEVLLHEIIHAASDLPESTVKELGKRLYGLLQDNTMFRRAWFADTVDREATGAEMNAVEDILNAQEKQEDQIENVIPLLLRPRAGQSQVAARQTDAVTVGRDDPPAEGEGGKPLDPTGNVTDATGGADVAAGQDNVAGLKVSYERIKSEKRALTDEARALRSKLKEYEDRDKTDGERAQDTINAQNEEIATLKAHVTEASKAQVFLVAVAEAGAVNPGSAYRLIDPDALTVLDDGSVTGVDEAVTALRESDPYMFGKAGGAPRARVTDAGADGDPQVRSNVTSEQRDLASKMGIKLPS